MQLWCGVVMLTRFKRNGNIQFRTVHGNKVCVDEVTAIGLFIKDAINYFPNFNIVHVSANVTPIDKLYEVINAQTGQ